MKKILFFAAVAALSAMISCQKEEAPSQKEAKPIVFSASIAAPSDTKVSVNTYDGKVSWVKDDEITITDGTYTGVYKADNAGETTTFTYVSGTKFTESGKYSATYGTMPAAGVDQTYSNTPGKLIYMTAPKTSTSATTANFTFTAQCGLLKLTLDADKTEGIKRIYVIDESGDAYKLLCETARSIEGGRDFYIALPAGKYSKYIIRDSEGYEAVKTANTGKETGIAANQINKVTFGSLTFNTPIYPESNTAGTKVAGYWWAPVNCGYDASHIYGLLYQWGRKVGGGYDSTEGMQTAIAATYTTDGYNKNPDGSKFYTQGSSPYDWYTSFTSKQLSVWPMVSTDAGYVEGKIANPCPNGWRVPANTELTALYGDNMFPSLVEVNGQYGCYFNGTSSASSGVFLPAAGWHYYYSSDTYGRGEFGNYWSSSVNGNGAWRLYISDCYADMNGNNRTFGYSVRCVQE